MNNNLTDEWGEGDGIDPRRIKKKIQSSLKKNKTDHSALRLAKQIENHLQVVFHGLASGTILSDFAINDVQPAGKGVSFVVQVYCIKPEREFEISEIQYQLREIKPQLRAEIAKAIHRKNTPDITFDVLPPNVARHPAE